MNAPIQNLGAADDVIQDVGRIAEIEGETSVVHTDAGTFHAKRAVGCLVDPEVGDKVLFGGSLSDRLYVLSVLERAGDGGATRIRVQGDLVMQVKDGRYIVTAAEGVDLASGQEITLTSREIRMRAAEGQAFFERFSYLGKKLFAEAEQVKTVVGLFDTVLERFSQRVKRSYRFIEELDQVRARQIDYTSEENLRLRGKNTLVTAKSLVKVDGGQIHLG